jgi:large subunit ribosomal protein L10
MVDARGLAVEQFSELRAKLRGARSRCQVVKNRILQKVVQQMGWTAAPGLFEGPTAIVTGTGEVTAVAGVIRDFAKVHELPVMKGGMLAGAPLSSADVKAMAELPPRPVMLAVFVGVVAAPMSRLAGVLRQKVASVLYVLKAAEEKKKAQGGA